MCEEIKRCQNCSQLIVDHCQVGSNMAQKMLSFFDERCLSENNLCESDKETEEQDQRNIININHSSPKQPSSPALIEALEYRIKVQSSTTEMFQAGETRRVLTNINVGKKPGKLSLLLKPSELTRFRFLSEGYLNPGCKGRLAVTLQNSDCSNAILPAGTVVAYMILTPFVQ